MSTYIRRDLGAPFDPGTHSRRPVVALAVIVAVLLVCMGSLA